MTKTKAKREEGHYWVRDGPRWRVAHWIQNQWFITHNEFGFTDVCFHEIDERRIIRPEAEAMETMPVELSDGSVVEFEV